MHADDSGADDGKADNFVINATQTINKEKVLS